MIIDFHTHAFNEKIVEKALASLTANSGLMPHGNGTVQSLVDIQRQNGVDLSIVCNIATKPTQHKVVNDFAASIQAQTPYAIGFGSVHPLAEDALDELDRIKALGLKGVKLHPDYQRFLVDDPRCIPIYEKISRLGLITVFHTGLDLGADGAFENTPERMSHILPAFSTPVVAAHLGGGLDPDSVLRYLVGRPNVYLDTAHCYGRMRHPSAIEIVRAHGPAHVLYGSDMPWSGPKEELFFIQSHGLSAEEEAKVLGGNAEKLLGL